ncbi:MAG: hypothetical protein ABSB32_13335 [Thermodesulfobacteriota bacterium]|jgi:hypothetical protein
MSILTKEQLLAEVEDIIRSMPPRGTIRHETPENFAWLGRVSAAIEQWNPTKTVPLTLALKQFHDVLARPSEEGFRTIMVLLHQAQSDLRLQTLGPLNIAVGSGMVFDYFDQLRKIIELAKQDILFVDPYLDAEFVSRYLGYVASGVSVRLLSEKKLSSLLPAVEAFARQSALTISVRSIPGIHDRYLFIDKSACYQSGASFKDGAKSAATLITQIVDAFPAMFQTYEELWKKAKVER